MTALSGYRDTRRMGDSVIPDILDLLVAGEVHIFRGAIVGLSGGYAAPAGPGCSRVVGMAESEANTQVPGFVAGSLRVRVRQGTFKVANSTGVDGLGLADLGSRCYAADDQTVAKTIGPNRPVAGTVMGVEPDGVWVQMNLDGRG